MSFLAVSNMTSLKWISNYIISYLHFRGDSLLSLRLVRTSPWETQSSMWASLDLPLQTPSLTCPHTCPFCPLLAVYVRLAKKNKLPLSRWPWISLVFLHRTSIPSGKPIALQYPAHIATHLEHSLIYPPSWFRDLRTCSITDAGETTSILQDRTVSSSSAHGQLTVSVHQRLLICLYMRLNQHKQW